MPVQVTIILVNFNCGQYILNCIQSINLFSKTVSFEIIIVDNASTDSSIQEVQSRFPAIRIIKNSRNIGFGAANNIGAGQAAGEYLFFLNADTELVNDCLSIFIKFFLEAGSDVASCGGKLVKQGGEYSVSFGNLPSVLQEFSDIGFRVFYRKYYNRHLSISPPCDFLTPKSVGYLSGADIFIKKDIFLKLGGFDERFFMYYEDTDLYFRLNIAGYKNYMIPEARIVHFGESALHQDGSFNYTKYAMTLKSKYLYFAKNIGEGTIFWIRLFQLITLIIHAKGRYRYNLRKMIGITMNPEI